LLADAAHAGTTIASLGGASLISHAFGCKTFCHAQTARSLSSFGSLGRAQDGNLWAAAKSVVFRVRVALIRTLEGTTSLALIVRKQLTCARGWRGMTGVENSE
jgi:hypothetical protein